MQKNKMTMKDLAQELGLSISVVSRVLSGKAGQYRISDKTRVAVRAAAKRHGFTPNQLARGLRLRKSHTIGLLIPDISNNFFSDVARSVEISARHRGYSIILCNTEESEAIERTSLELLLARKVDGVIVAPVAESGDCGHLLALLNDNVPIVLLDRFFPGAGLPHVTSDNVRGGYDGAQHLLKCGHRRIGFIQGIPNAQTNIDRLAGYRAALQEFGVEFDPQLVVGHDFGEQNGHHSALTLLGQSHPPTALFVTSSVGALGAMRACVEIGRKIPDEVSIIGFDEYPYAALLSPPLTTIAQQTTLMGQAVCDLLITWLESGEIPERRDVVLPTNLVPRVSVKNLAAQPLSA
ncbi:MAG: LacI family DNA-binding transcriptional regulator [Candidatus Hydrogenedentes bacterium]|nr:LacI family DNA-binding transcriptional regulator [Candidatus Hydrogenedentota bacterium]